MPQENLMDKIVSLCKRRGFVFQSSEIYGGLSNSWDYGPLGVELKLNVKNAWWKSNVQARDDMVGLDAAILMHPKTWEASGHTASFADILVDCKKCKKRITRTMLPSCLDWCAVAKQCLGEQRYKDYLKAKQWKEEKRG